MKQFFFAILILAGFSTAAQITEEPTAADYQKMSEALKSDAGLVLEVHGGDIEHGLFVLTWRDKNDFFKYMQLPVTGRNKDAKQIIAGLHRHDRVRIWGEFDLFLPEGQRHIDADRIVVENAFKSACQDLGLPPYQHQVKLPDDLKGLSEIIVQVHGVMNGGQTLMVQYKDTLVPVIAPDPSKVAGLFKGDKIKIHFTLAPYPKSPVHLQLIQGDDAVKVLRPVTEVNPKDQNDKPKRCGTLVMFKDSPVITSNVFALKSDIGDGYDWTFTLFNADPKIFASIREKAQSYWDSYTAFARCGRNYVYNPSITVCATGAGNEEDASQANPQIMVESPDDLSFELATPD